MLNDLLLELDQLAQRNRELLCRVRAAKAALRDTRAQEKKMREGKVGFAAKPEMNDFLADDHLPDRRARASSCIIPPSLQLQIGGGCRSADSLPLSPYPLLGLGDGSPARPSSSRLERSVTLPDLHKPLPPTPRTPQWPQDLPIACGKGPTLPHDSGTFSSSDDELALLLNNISFESEAVSQLPFVPGQSYVRLPRRIAEEEPARPTPPAPRPENNAPAIIIAPCMSRLLLEDPSIMAINKTPALGSTTPPTSSPSRRLKKRFEDYLPRSILTQKPKHGRSRTLSPSRTPSQNRHLTTRAKSTHDLERAGRRGVKL